MRAGAPRPSLLSAPDPPALSTAESAPRLIARRGRTPSEIARWIFGALLLLTLATWLIDSFVSSPSRFTEVTLHPRVTISSGDPALAQSLHDEAERICFIAQSVNFPVTHAPTIELA